MVEEGRDKVSPEERSSTKTRLHNERPQLQASVRGPVPRKEADRVHRSPFPKVVFPDIPGHTASHCRAKPQ